MLDFLNGYDNLKLSFLLVIVALILLVVYRKLSATLKFIAMGISFCADMMLAKYEPFIKLFGGFSFQIGAGMFMLAHIVYFLAFFVLIKNSKDKIINKGFFYGLGVVLLFIIGLVGLYINNSSADMALFVLCLVYCFVIGILCVVVFIYAFNKKGIAYINIVGIVCFMISDFLIAVNLVGGIDFQSRGALVWIFYPIGQLLLIIDNYKVSKK